MADDGVPVSSRGAATAPKPARAHRRHLAGPARCRRHRRQNDDQSDIAQQRHPHGALRRPPLLHRPLRRTAARAVGDRRTAETTRLVTAFDAASAIRTAVVGSDAPDTSSRVRQAVDQRRHRRRHRGESPPSTSIRSSRPPSAAIIFSGRHERAGFEPWFSDGTAAGTRLVADIGRGRPGLDPQQLTDFGGTLLFSRRRHGPRARAVAQRRHRRRHPPGGRHRARRGGLLPG